MAWIRTVTPDEARSGGGLLAELYRRHRRPDGLVDHILTVSSSNPETLRRHLELYEHLMRGSSGLTPAERELIAVAVSVTNGCHY